ncbi:unnamed protein product, partial [Brenthis ino]
MPPIYQIDNFEDCFISPNNVYCSVHFNLVSDQPSELLHLIQEYSKHIVTHYNHTKLRYGVCVTKSCQHIRNESAVSRHALEECLNSSMWENYELKTQVENYSCYNQYDNNYIDTADIIVGVVLMFIVLLNIVGSIYDTCSGNTKDRSVLVCFSIKRNWRRLTSCRKNMEPRLQRLKGLNGIRCIVLYGVILVHCYWAYVVAVENSHELELMFHSLPLYLFFNGPIAIQTYIVICGFLLAYKMQIYSEKHSTSWRTVPKALLLRYLRLTPAYALTIALMATWLKFAGPSALWEVTAKPSFADCQKRWWINLLYLNNFVYDSQCMVHGWYLAVDMQLYFYGLILCVLLKKTNYRKIILISIFIIGFLIPGVLTYIHDLQGAMLFIPSEANYLFKTEPTFNKNYKTTYGNIPSFVIGLSLGYLVYSWQQKDINIEKYKKFRIIYWALFPLILAIVLSGTYLYRDAPIDPIYVRVLFATFTKPLYGVTMALLICGLIFKIEGIYRKFLELDMWTIPSTLSYGIYVVHFSFIRIHVAMNSHLFYITSYNLILMTTCIAAVSFIAAVPLWLFVEAPFIELIKYVINLNAPPKEKKVLNIEKPVASTYL